jgi:hypothetical protein
MCKVACIHKEQELVSEWTQSPRSRVSLDLDQTSQNAQDRSPRVVLPKVLELMTA